MKHVDPGPEDTQRVLANLRDTVFLDTQKHKGLLLKLKEAEKKVIEVGSVYSSYGKIERVQLKPS